jgi:hypothetical protein
MRKVPSIDLGSVRIPDNASPDAVMMDSLRAEPTSRPLGQFSTKELRDELLDRGCTDFSRLQPFIRNALLLVIFALVVVTYWGMKCMDGEMFGFVCSIAL